MMIRRTLTLAAALALLAAPAWAATTILFVGNSFTYGATSPVWKYRAGTVTDLNGGGVGGAPALFKAFADQAGLDYAVSLETVGGSDLALHLREKRSLIDRSWDHVVMHGYSTLDRERPGDATALIRDADLMARMFAARNPGVQVRLTATWARADQTWRPGGHWYGRPIAAMAQDIQAAYVQADAASPNINGVIPVGLAWNRAFETGVADPNPYDGTPYGQINLWGHDSYHGSSFGYYLEALMVFGAVTGRDPRSLGPKEIAAAELGFSEAQAGALQQIAYDALAARAP